MGGRIFESCRRINRVEFEYLSNELLSVLRNHSSARSEIIRTWRSKDSFGDIDILISTQRTEDILKVVYPNSKISRNSSVVSFLHPSQVQVDLIEILPESFDSALNYLSWDLLGNFMGRVIGKTGFKYGFEGLTFIVRDGVSEFEQIRVSQDTSKIFEFFDYDYQRFTEGFNTLEEIFQFASSSRYFNPNLMLLENRSNASARRDRVRPTYMQFLEWLKSRTDVPYYPWEDFNERGGYNENAEWLESAFRVFEGFKDKYEYSTRCLRDHRLYKKIFNSDRVGELVGLRGRGLNALMQILISDFPDRDSLKSWIISSKKSDVIDWVWSGYERMTTEELE